MKLHILLFAFITSSFASDNTMKQCINHAKNNTETVNCVHAEYDIVYKMMEEKYNELFSLIKDKKAKSDLKKSQDTWLEFHKFNHQFVSSYYIRERQGTQWYPVIADYKLERLKDRYEELNAHVKMAEF